MGQTGSSNAIQQQYDILKANEDGSALLCHRKNRQQFLLRRICSNIGQQINGFEELLRKRQIVKCPHLLDIVQIRKKQQKNVCSVAYKLYLLIEYPFRTLRDQIIDKTNKGKPVNFLEAQLWSILYSCSVALNTLYEKKISHESLTNKQIFISKDGLIKISDPLLLGLQKNYIRVLKKQNQNIHISPQIMNFLDDCNFSFYDKQKSDVFILGTILLQAAILKPVYLLQKQSKKPLLDNIPKAVKELKSRYSKSFSQMIQRMLQLHSKSRPKFQDIINSIQQDNNLYEDVQQQTSIQNLGHPQQDKKLKIKRGNGSNNQNLTSIPKKASCQFQRTNVLQKKVLNTQQQRNKIGEPQTIINKLQSELSKKQNSMQKQILPQSFNYVFANHQKPINMPQSPAYGTYSKSTNFVNYVEYPNYNQPLKNYSPLVFGKVPIGVNGNQNFNVFHPSQVADDRFSYSKFGNIQLKHNNVNMGYHMPNLTVAENPQKNYRINQQQFSYTPNFQYQPTVILQQPRSSPETQINIQHQPTNINSLQLNHQQTHSIQTPVSSIPQLNLRNLQPSKTKNSQTNYNNLVAYNLPVPTNSTNSANASLINNSNTNNSTNFANTTNPNNSTNASVSKDGSFNKISLSAVYKQTPEKNGLIYPITQKSQEQNLESTSKKKQSKNNSIKLNQPRKSPGLPQNKSSKNILTLPEEKVSHFGNIKTDENQTKFQTLTLLGGGKYEGYTKNGKKNGHGKLEFNDGGYYQGQWRDNKMHGYGILYYQNGKIAYKGEWNNDQFCGKGSVYNDKPLKVDEAFNYYDFAQLGDMWIYYEGQFKNDSKHGKGKIRLTNGQVFQGNFCHDYIQGEGVFYTVKGEAVHGIWRDNMLIQR